MGLVLIRCAIAGPPVGFFPEKGIKAFVEELVRKVLNLGGPVVTGHTSSSGVRLCQTCSRNKGAGCVGF